MLRLLHRPDETSAPGWVTVNTPLGALAHVHVNSSAHDLCEDWRLLSSGRMHFLDRANFAHHFGQLCTTAPIGVVAELLWANNMQPQFAALVAPQSDARAHMLNLRAHCFGLDREEWERLDEAIDIARCVDARLAARAAAAEASDGD